MKFTIESLGKRLLDDSILFRIKEQLLVSLCVFYIGLLRSCVKDAGEDTPLIHLAVIAFSSFLTFAS